MKDPLQERVLLVFSWTGNVLNDDLSWLTSMSVRTYSECICSSDTARRRQSEAFPVLIFSGQPPCLKGRLQAQGLCRRRGICNPLKVYKMQNNRAIKHKWLAEIIPAQHTGVSASSKSRIKCRNGNQAQEAYRVAATRLLNVNHWHDYAGIATAAFRLTDREGNPLNREVAKGDYIRINIPGPGNPEGNGDDWVQVLQVGNKNQDHLQLTYLTVRVSDNPLDAKTATAHFFDQAATSTFVVYRENLTITAAVYGRNERVNRKTGNWFTRLRNWLIYMGAQLVFSNLQWKSLTRGLLRQEQ